MRTYTPPSDRLNATQRKSIGAGIYKPRKRTEHEATGTLICNASMRQPYKTGDGDTLPFISPERLRAFSLPSKGLGA